MRVAALLVWTGAWLLMLLIGLLLLGVIVAGTAENLLEDLLGS